MQDALGQRFDMGVRAAIFDGYPLVDVEVLEGLDTAGAMGMLNATWDLKVSL